MNFDDFVKKWDGKGIDFDGAYGDQCMDLMHQYLVEVLGISDGSVLAAPSAKDVYNNFLNIKGRELFEKIENTPTGVPQKGDIVFWEDGQWGHVAMFIDGDINSFNSFDQNWPVGSPSHVQKHNYNGVLGWLRSKTKPQDCDPNWRIERDTNWGLYQGQIEENKKLTERIKELEGQVNDTRQLYEDEQKHNIELTNQIKDISSLIEKIKNEDKNHAVARLNAEHARDEVTVYFKTLTDALGLSQMSEKPKELLSLALEEIKKNKAPQDETIRYVERLHRALEESGIYKRVRSHKWFEKIMKWIR